VQDNGRSPEERVVVVTSHDAVDAPSTFKACAAVVRCYLRATEQTLPPDAPLDTPGARPDISNYAARWGSARWNHIP
jgi:hypothetical protein